MFASRRVYYTIGALVCLAILMAGCGGQSPATPGPEQREAPAEPAAPTEPAAPSEPAAPTADPADTEFRSPLEQETSPLPTPTGAPETEADKPSTGPVPLEITAPATAPLTGEVPQDLLDTVFDDLTERLSASREAIAVEQAGVVVWRDGALGCPQPGMMYTQALVPGYRILLQVGDETFDYHASEAGYFVLCEGGLAEDPLPPGSGGGSLVDQ